MRLGGDVIISVSLLTKKQLGVADVWFYETKLQPSGEIIPEKMLLVIDDEHVAKEKYNLTKMGAENVNTMAELAEYFGLSSTKPYNLKQ